MGGASEAMRKPKPPSTANEASTTKVNRPHRRLYEAGRSLMSLLSLFCISAENGHQYQSFFERPQGVFLAFRQVQQLAAGQLPRPAEGREGDAARQAVHRDLAR